jgi:hypothetical protein
MESLEKMVDVVVFPTSGLGSAARGPASHRLSGFFTYVTAVFGVLLI